MVGAATRLQCAPQTPGGQADDDADQGRGNRQHDGIGQMPRHRGADIDAVDQRLAEIEMQEAPEELAILHEQWLRSRPSAHLAFSISCAPALSPSMAATGSPGKRRMAKKTKLKTRKAVKIASPARFKTKPSKPHSSGRGLVDGADRDEDGPSTGATAIGQFWRSSNRTGRSAVTGL